MSGVSSENGMSGAAVSFTATIVHLDGNARIALVGELDLVSFPDLDEVMAKLIVEGPTEIVLDFSRLSFIDSSGIACLIKMQNQLVTQGRKLTILSPQMTPLKVFEITGLVDFLNVESGHRAQ
jgi:anti-sigma B factor antagonist